MRRDLQGIRGLGVCLVISAHLTGWPIGAMSAMDWFFVLSGYLITRNIASPLIATGRFELRGFFLARVRRLLPAALLVLVLTGLGVWLVYGTAQVQQLLPGLLAATFWVANWHLIGQGSDYFDDSEQSPVLHFWSLSVEEQFYAVWPILLLLGVRWAKSPRVRRAVLTGLVGAVTLAGFIYSVRHSGVDPGAAYYSTLDRSWTLGLGGLLALTEPSWLRWPSRLRTCLGWLGAALLLPPIFLLSTAQAYPGPWALAGGGATVLFIIGGTRREAGWCLPIDNRVFACLGTLSYSLYLCHIAVNHLLHAYVQDVVIYRVLAVALAAAVGAGLYYGVERPMRYAPWLMRRRERRRALWDVASTHKARQGGIVGVLGVVCVGFVVTALVPPTPVDERVARRLELVTASPARDRSPALVEQQDRLAAALSAYEFPDFDPPLDDLGFELWTSQQAEFGCTTVPLGDLGACRYGDKGPLAVVVGDSFAVSWMPALRPALLDLGWQVQQFTQYGCTAWVLDRYLTKDGEENVDCTNHHVALLEFVQTHQVDTLVLASAWAEADFFVGSGAAESRRRQVARQGLRNTIRALGPWVQRVVVIESPPNWRYLPDCVKRLSTPADCASYVADGWYDHVEGERAAARSEGAAYVSTLPWFCLDNLCPAWVGRTPATLDGGHLARDVAKLLYPLMRDALAAYAHTES